MGRVGCTQTLPLPLWGREAKVEMYRPKEAKIELYSPRKAKVELRISKFMRTFTKSKWCTGFLQLICIDKVERGFFIILIQEFNLRSKFIGTFSKSKWCTGFPKLSRIYKVRRSSLIILKSGVQFTSIVLIQKKKAKRLQSATIT